MTREERERGTGVAEQRAQEEEDRQRALEELKPEFELSDEYLEIVYRQYIMYAGVAVFPWITVITLLANIFEYFFDKHRLLHMTKRPLGSLVGGQRALALYLGVTAFFSLITFPSGAVWFAGPLGPYLCWPCPHYTRVETGMGTCRPAFEKVTCSDSAGRELGVHAVRRHVHHLLLPLAAPARVASELFITSNHHLFTSRRCACRPCVNAIACGCDEPVLENDCKHTPAFVDPADQSTCTTVGDNCTKNSLYWDIMQCDVPRYNYSQEAHLAWQSYCIGGPSDGQECTVHSECEVPAGTETNVSSGYCDLYCPTPRATDTFFPVLQCWECPEVATHSLADPKVAKKVWEGLSLICRKVTCPIFLRDPQY